MSEEDRTALVRLEEKFNNLLDKVTGWMDTTTDYRLSLCEKIAEVNIEPVVAAELTALIDKEIIAEVVEKLN